MIPTARVQRGPSEAARCASKGIVPATPTLFFSILLGAGSQCQRRFIELTAHAINDTQQSRLADHFRF
jgi:hypothetical protein